MNAQERSRVNYIDVARGIAMICIILGHLGIFTINRVVFTFHVPIFYLITGYFSSPKRTVKDVFEKRLKSLMIPYFATCLAICVLGFIKSLVQYGPRDGFEDGFMWLYASLYGAGDSYDTPFYIKSIGAIWFLWSTFWGAIFLQFSMRFNKYLKIVFVIILFAVGYYSRSIMWFPLSIQAGCCATLFMYIGYLVKVHKSQIESIPDWGKYVLIGFASVMWIQFIVNFESFWLVHCDIGRGIIDILGCLCACYMILIISKIIDNKLQFAGRFLSFIGRNSILVLGIHIVELNLFPWHMFTEKLMTFGFNDTLILLVLILCKLMMIITLMILGLKIRPVCSVYGCQFNDGIKSK